MSQITIGSFPYTLAQGSFTTGTVELRIWFTGGPGQQFIDADSNIVPYGNATDFYKRVACTVAANVITVSQFTLPSTDNSSNVSTVAKAQFYVDGSPAEFLFTDWIITATLGNSITFNALYTFNLAASIPFTLNATYLTAPQVAALIQSSSPGSLVQSVFGRVGVVIATTGDYSSAQLSDSANIPRLNINNTFTGNNAITQAIATSGSPTAFKVIGAAHTTLAASTEAPDISFALARTVQFASGALTTQRSILITPPTYSFTAPSTITRASTMEITGAPIAGTNATITDPIALAVYGTTRIRKLNIDLNTESNALGLGISGQITGGNSTGAQTGINVIFTNSGNNTLNASAAMGWDIQNLNTAAAEAIGAYGGVWSKFGGNSWGVHAKTADTAEDGTGTAEANLYGFVSELHRSQVATGSKFAAGFLAYASGLKDVDVGYGFWGPGSAFDYGLDQVRTGRGVSTGIETPQTINNALVRSANSTVAIAARNAASNADLTLLTSDSSNRTVVGGNGLLKLAGLGAGIVTTDASGIVSIASSTSTAAGSNTQFQYNNSGALAGTAFLTNVTDGAGNYVAANTLLVSGDGFVVKGNGGTELDTAFAISHTGSAGTISVNYLTVYASGAGNPTQIGATGTDSNININLLPKGSGVVMANSKTLMAADYSNATPAPGIIVLTATGVNFNSVADTAFTITLPSGFTRFALNAVFIGHASTSISTATVGLFTAAAGGGTAIVTSASAVTVTTASESTNNNAQQLTLNNATTVSYNNATLYFRVTGAQGSAATADVTLYLRPMP